MKEQDLRSIIRKEIRSALTEKVSAALNTRMARVDKTQAMKMLQKVLQSKPASQQAEFVADLVKKLNLKSKLI